MRGVVLGGGVSGLAAGIASGFPVFEAADRPGGICTSYYLGPGDGGRRLDRAGADRYRFEIGGGHWIFGGDPAVLALLQSVSPMRRYERRSSVYFPAPDLLVPYPLQDHLHHLGAPLAHRALADLLAGGRGGTTMKEWLEASFGHTLCREFFHPFHELYTAGLVDRIAPQDPFKSPVNLHGVLAGAFGQPPAKAGYNVTFAYPDVSLGGLAAGLARRCRVHYGKRAVRVDLDARAVHFADGTSVGYDVLLSTLALTEVAAMSDLATSSRPDPYTSVLVVNLGAARGARCPSDHWIYVPSSRAGFHRVGFYSNVDPSFLPAGRRRDGDRVAIYVERAYAAGCRPSPEEQDRYARAAVEELQEWGFIGEVEVLDPTWIDVAYTWQWPGSTWRSATLQALEERSVFQVGRYGRWVFQGIADSVRDGLMVGAALGRGGGRAASRRSGPLLRPRRSGAGASA